MNSNRALALFYVFIALLLHALALFQLVTGAFLEILRVAAKLFMDTGQSGVPPPPGGKLLFSLSQATLKNSMGWFMKARACWQQPVPYPANSRRNSGVIALLRKHVVPWVVAYRLELALGIPAAFIAMLAILFLVSVYRQMRG